MTLRDSVALALIDSLALNRAEASAQAMLHAAFSWADSFLIARLECTCDREAANLKSDEHQTNCPLFPWSVYAQSDED